MKFYAEAPGKTILLGEHFVVYGAKAVAAAISQTIVTEVRHSDTDYFESFVESSNAIGAPAFQRLGDTNPISRCIEHTKKHFSTTKKFAVRMRSSLPEKAGLGSSAAAAVSAVAAVAHAVGIRPSLEEVVDIAMKAEKEIHGNPSGIDIETAVRGGVILFAKGLRTRKIQLRRPIPLLLAYSGLLRDTSQMIERVSQFRHSYPSFFKSVTNSCEKMSILMKEALEEGDVKGIGSIMAWNHAVLRAIGASNKNLDSLVNLCIHEGCTSAKLTGAGGGGFVVALPFPGKEGGTLRRLRDNEVVAWKTLIPQRGLRVWKSAS